MSRSIPEVLVVVLLHATALSASDSARRLQPQLPPQTSFVAPPAPVLPADDAAANTAMDADFNAEGEPLHRDLQVLFIMSWNDPRAEAELRRLERVDGAFQQLRERGWRVGVDATDQLRIVSADQVREIVEKLDLQVFPSVVALHEGEVIRSFRSGCATPLDAATFEWLRTGVSRRPVDEPLEPVTVEWTGSYPLRGAHWSVEGSYSPSLSLLLRHLRGANHRNLIPAEWPLESWSYEELRSLHDDLHERNQPRPLVQKSSPDTAGPTARGEQVWLVP